MSDEPKNNPILGATRTRARTVIPIVKELEAEIGKERANAIVGKAIAKNCVKRRDKRSFDLNPNPGQTDDSEPSFPIEHDVVEKTDETYGHDLVGCAFAEYSRDR